MLQKEERKRNISKYLVPALGLISIGVTIAVALLVLNLQSRALDELAESMNLSIKTLEEVRALKMEEVLRPVVTFNKVGDVNKEAPKIYADNEEIKRATRLEPYGDDGFLVEWKKEKGEWLTIVWELNRKNYEERYRYFLYVEARANVEQDIAIIFKDDEKRYVQKDMKVGEETTREVIALASLNDYKKDGLDENAGEWVENSEDNFNWHSVQEVMLAPFKADKVDNTVFFEKMVLLIAR